MHSPDPHPGLRYAAAMTEAFVATLTLWTLSLGAQAPEKVLQHDKTADSGPSGQEKADPVIAEGRGGILVRTRELESLVLDRFALVGEGRELLDLLFKAKLLDELARKEGIEVTHSSIAARWEELDRRARAAGEKGIVDQIERRGLGIEEFRDFLRLSIVQERLTQKALGLGDKDPVTGAQQEIWLKQEIQARGLEQLPPPWESGIVARCEALTIGTEEFARFLHARLSRQKIVETAWHLLLIKVLERRLPDLSERARTRAIETEIQRRRKAHAREYPGVTFEQRLGASGQTLETLRLDPAISIAALTRLWVDRKHGPDGLRETYEEERELFEGLYGRAAQTSLLLLVAGQFANELVPRTFGEAEKELSQLKEKAGDIADFRALVERFTEDPTGRESKGALGWVTRGDPRYPVAVREALFDFLDTGGDVPAGGLVLGPVRLEKGCTLLWISDVRESPPWEIMIEHVNEELRRRLVEEVMPFDSVKMVEGA